MSLYGEEIMIVGRTMWAQCTSVTNRQTDRQTDGQTDRITITKTVQRRASHGNNSIHYRQAVESGSTHCTMYLYVSINCTFLYTHLHMQPHWKNMPVSDYIHFLPARQHSELCKPLVQPEEECPSVCPSVRHTPVLYQNEESQRHDFFTIREPEHSSFQKYLSYHEIRQGSP